ncbi:MAG: putative redox protein [Marinoscillum sp.]|jgi:putative redox protein
MKVNLGFKSDHEYYAVNESGNRLEIDMHAPEEKQAMSPMQLLLAGLIACAAVDIVNMVKKRRKTLIDFKGEIDGERREELPNKFIKIDIKYIFVSPDLETEEAQKLVDLAVEKYCSVASSIDPAIPFTHIAEVVRP